MSAPPPAIAYGRLLRGHMERTGMTAESLATEIGSNRGYIFSIRRGLSFPRLEKSAAIADALMAPKLHDYVLKARTRECSLCGRSFVANHRAWTRSRYCSTRCSSLLRWRKHDARKREVKARTAARNAYRLEEYAEGVDAYCRSCEPEGLCRAAACPLRPVSPLPLVEKVAA